MSVFGIQDSQVQKAVKNILEGIEDITTLVGNNSRKLDDIDIRLDDIDIKLDSIFEIVSANGQGIEVLSDRVDKLE